MKQLFGDLYIGQHPTPLKNSYAVIEFELSGLDNTGEEAFKNSFSQHIQEDIVAFINYYRDFIPKADSTIQKVRVIPTSFSNAIPVCRRSGMSG